MESQREILINLTKILGFKPAVDGLMSAISGKLVIDIFAFDNQLQAHCDGYNPEDCTYQGTLDNLSMHEFVKGKFGDEAVRLIELML